MRFCDLFLSYKIGLKAIPKLIPFRKLPLYRKIIAITIFIVIALYIFALLFFDSKYESLIFFVAIVFIMICFFYFDSRQDNSKEMLDKHYSPYSKKKINLIKDVLKEYNIDYQDKEKIDQLIEEAKIAQTESDYLLPIKKPFTVLCSLVIPVLAYSFKKFGDTLKPVELYKATLVLVSGIIIIAAILLAVVPMLRTILYRDYYKYDEFIYDLRQLRIFGEKKEI